MALNVKVASQINIYLRRAAQQVCILNIAELIDFIIINTMAELDALFKIQFRKSEFPLL